MTVARAWLPRRADFERVVELRRRVARRIVVPPAEARRPDGKPLRGYALLSDRVVKYRPPEMVAVEACKTDGGVRIGAATGLFRVPRLLGSEPAEGWMDLERIDGLVPLHDVLMRERDRTRLLALAGRSLAAIHAQLELPEAMRRPLPEPWTAPYADLDVVLHGDFNTRNLFVEGSGELVVTDWETSLRAYSPQPGAAQNEPTIGPRYFDVAWFVGSLFGRTWFGLRRIPDAAGCARTFVSAYFDAAGAHARPAGFPLYLAAFADALEARESAAAPSRIDRLLHPRSYIRTSCTSLRALARDLG
jgi:hypothetical protein